MTTEKATEKTSALITAYFAADHDRLDSLFAEFMRLKGTDFPAAKGFFKDFLRGLKRHIVWEEDVLFPIFEERSGMKDEGPTAIMRQEHRLIGAALEALHDKVRRADAACEKEARQLTDTLLHHNFKEERVLYPTLDQMIRPEEAAGIFHDMEAIPQERFMTCCGSH